MATQPIDPVDLWHGWFKPLDQPSCSVYCEVDDSYDGPGAAPLIQRKERIGFLPWLVTSDGDTGDKNS